MAANLLRLKIQKDLYHARQNGDNIIANALDVVVKEIGKFDSKSSKFATDDDIREILLTLIEDTDYSREYFGESKMFQFAEMEVKNTSIYRSYLAYRPDQSGETSDSSES